MTAATLHRPEVSGRHSPQGGIAYDAGLLRHGRARDLIAALGLVPCRMVRLSQRGDPRWVLSSTRAIAEVEHCWDPVAGGSACRFGPAIPPTPRPLNRTRSSLAGSGEYRELLRHGAGEYFPAGRRSPIREMRLRTHTWGKEEFRRGQKKSTTGSYQDGVNSY